MFKVFFGSLFVGALLVSYQNCANDVSKGRGFKNPTLPSEISKPNIILVLVDDLAYKDLNFLTSLKKSMIDEGTSLSRFYANTPLCCPSRTSILRGQYTHNTKIYKNVAGFDTFHNSELEKSTVATWLSGAGYKTALIGKYLNGYEDYADKSFIPPGWSYWVGLVSPQADFKYTLNVNGTVKTFSDKEEDYQTDVYAKYALDFLDQQSAQAPFFLYMSFNAPHSPLSAAPRHARAISAGTLPAGTFVVPPLGTAFDEEDVSDKPNWIAGLPRLSANDLDIIRKRYKDRMESMYAVQEAVDAIINKLKAKNFYNNTYIFFVSDNGFHLGDHRMIFGKSTTFETDVRVPFVVIGPGVRKGVELSNLAGVIDLAPTWMDLADLDAPEFVDGTSLVPLFRASGDVPTKWRNTILLEHWGGASEDAAENDPKRKGDQPTVAGVRTNNGKYLEYEDGSGEFYDETLDPEELQNKINDPAMADRISNLKDRLNRLRTCAGATCR